MKYGSLAERPPVREVHIEDIILYFIFVFCQPFGSVLLYACWSFVAAYSTFFSDFFASGMPKTGAEHRDHQQLLNRSNDKNQKATKEANRADPATTEVRTSVHPPFIDRHIAISP